MLEIYSVCNINSSQGYLECISVGYYYPAGFISSHFACQCDILDVGYLHLTYVSDKMLKVTGTVRNTYKKEKGKNMDLLLLM